MGKYQDPIVRKQRYYHVNFLFAAFVLVCFINYGFSFIFWKLIMIIIKHNWSEIVTVKLLFYFPSPLVTITFSETLFFSNPPPSLVLPPLALLSVTQTHLRQSTSNAEVAQPVDSVHHTSTSSSSTSFSSVQVGSQHTHTATVTFHLAGPSAARVSPQLPLRGWVCAPGAALRWLGGLKCVMNHLDSDSCPKSGWGGFSLAVLKMSYFQVTLQLRRL